jgi:predicted acylesterase/phospholipase RssA
MPRHLVFAGGGPRCLAFMAALDILRKKECLNNVKHFWGNSAGALVATMMALKVPSPKLKHIMNTLNFTRFRDIDLGNIVSFGENWGLDSGEAMKNTLRELLEDIKPGASQYTMQEVPGLHITAADLTATKPVILDSTTFPTLKLVDALRASTSIPFFYIPFRNPINNHLLVDGAVACNFPWILLPSDKDRAEALGFDFTIVDYSKAPESLSEFVPKILNFRESCWGTDKLKPRGPNIIRFNVRGFPAWHLAVKPEDRMELFQIGEETINSWLDEMGTDWLLTLHTGSKTQQTAPLCAPPQTPGQERPSGQEAGLSGSHECSSPQLPRGSVQDLSSPRRLSSRRWSV